jgi:tetratricopeptide (TPR) repeat protein
MIGKVFRIFREKGGLLKALELWDWFESLEVKKQKAVKKYYSIKVIKNLNFPYKAKHFDSGQVDSPLYTKRTFLATIAQTALLEGDYETAEWLYREALRMEGTPYEAHLILNDLLLLAQKLKDFEKMKEFCRKDIELYPLYREELRSRNMGSLPQINSFEVWVYLLEREGKIQEALDFIEFIRRENIAYPYYEEVKKRLEDKLQKS